MHERFTLRWTDPTGTSHSVVVVDDDLGTFVQTSDGNLHGPYADDESARSAHPTSLCFGAGDTVEINGLDADEASDWLVIDRLTTVTLDGFDAYVDDDGTIVDEDHRYERTTTIDRIEWEDESETVWGYVLERVGAHYFVGNYDGECQPMGVFGTEHEAIDHFRDWYTPSNVELDGDSRGQVVSADACAHAEVDGGVSPDSHRWRPDEPDESDLLLRIDALLAD